MADPNERDLPSTGDGDDLDEIEAQIAPDPAIAALRETDPDKANELEIQRLRAANQRLLGRQRAQQLRGYTESVVKEQFPFAPIDLVTGTTKAEIRRSAERLHTHNKAMFEAMGLTPEVIAKIKTGEQAGDPTAAATSETPAGQPKPGSRDFGAGPAAASETVAAQTVPDWEELKQKAATGQLDRRSVLSTIGESGVRVLQRPSLAGAVRRAHSGPGR